MPDLTFGEFLLALAPSLGVPGKPSHELTVVAERVYDALVGAGLDVRAVVEGRPVLTRDEGALLVGAMPLQGFPVEPRPDLSRLRELEAELRADEAQQRRSGMGVKVNRSQWMSAANATKAARVKLTRALDVIEKGGARG